MHLSSVLRSLAGAGVGVGVNEVAAPLARA